MRVISLIVLCAMLMNGNALPPPLFSVKYEIWERDSSEPKVPHVGKGIDMNDPLRGGKLLPKAAGALSGAFMNAYQLMSYAISTADSETNKAIFAKYFPPEDKQLVMDLFGRLLGDAQGTGSPAMTSITIVYGKHDPTGRSCASLKGGDNPKPVLSLYEEAWVYANRDDIPGACDLWRGVGMMKSMYLLGSILLQEYMHWDWYLSSIHHGKTSDNSQDIGGHDWEFARSLPKSSAKYNAVSYGWYATEVFWATICAKPGGYD